MERVASTDSTTADLRAAMDQLRDEMTKMRSENNAGLSVVASNTGAVKRHLDNVTGRTGGDSVSVALSA